VGAKGTAETGVVWRGDRAIGLAEAAAAAAPILRLSPGAADVPAAAASGAPVELAAPQRPLPPPPGGWPSGITRARVLDLIRRCEDRTDRFKRSFARALDNSRLDGRRAEDVLNERARQLERAMDRVKKDAERDRYADARGDVRDALAAGRDINRALRVLSLRTETERMWQALRGELNTLARLFKLSPLD
jgi:hypothetical protein